MNITEKFIAGCNTDLGFLVIFSECLLPNSLDLLVPFLYSFGEALQTPSWNSRRMLWLLVCVLGKVLCHYVVSHVQALVVSKASYKGLSSKQKSQRCRPILFLQCDMCGSVTEGTHWFWQCNCTSSIVHSSRIQNIHAVLPLKIAQRTYYCARRGLMPRLRSFHFLNPWIWIWLVTIDTIWKNGGPRAPRAPRGVTDWFHVFVKYRRNERSASDNAGMSPAFCTKSLI